MSEELTVRENVALGTLQAHGPADMVEGATAVATELAKVVKRCQLFTNISGREYVRCEGWTTLAALLGCTPQEVSNTHNPDDGSYTAVVELVRMTDGRVVSRASAECGTVDDGGTKVSTGEWWTWNDRPRYARRSMAATRATGKACRVAFSWVMTMAGYEVTPAEEMDGVQQQTPTVEGEAVWPFGPKRGKPLSESDNDDIDSARGWCLRNDKTDWAAMLQDELDRRLVQENTTADAVEVAPPANDPNTLFDEATR